MNTDASNDFKHFMSFCIYSIMPTNDVNSLTASPYFIPQPPEARLLLNLGVFGTSLAPKLINLP